MHCRSRRAVRWALLLLWLAGSGCNSRCRAADAASTDGHRVYQVQKKVADFPDREDLSSPETAHAAIGRNWVKEGDWGPGWQRLCVPELANLPPRTSQPLPKDKADIVLGSEILEVHVLDATHAVVISQRKDFDRENRVIELNWMRRIGGRWLNEGYDRDTHLDKARQKVRRLPIRADGGSWYFFTRRFWIRKIAGYMHNPLVISFGDGKAFFVGITVVSLAVLLLLRFRRKLAAVPLVAAALIGIAGVVLSATPMPMWAYAAWLGTAATSLLLCRLPPTHKARLAATGSLLAASMGLCAAEIPHYRFPHVSVGRGETIYVLGDSLSAGKDPSSKECPWPAVLGDMMQLSVVNLAQPAARLRGAMEQAKRVTRINAPVILEIGANDTVEDGLNVAEFRKQLDALLGSLHDHHPVLMFEIPLFPLQNAYGQAQREVAAKYGVILIPKRCLMSVWRLKGGTLDGIHFSQTGHDALAGMIADVLRIEDAASPVGDPISASKPASAVADEPLAPAPPTRP